MSSYGGAPDLRQCDDEALIQLLVSGQCEALNEIMKRHRGMVLSIARHILKDEAEAEDTAQDVFLETLQLTKFDSDYGRLTAWLRKTAQRRALDRRKHLGRRGYYSAASLDEEATQQSAHAQTPESARRMQELLEPLKPKERQAMILKYVRGYTDKEIATLTGDSIRAVRYTLFLSKRKLKSAHEL